MVHRKHDITAIVGFVLILLSIASFHSEFRLRSDMPPEFFDRAQIPRNKRSSEEKIAKAYWDCAVKEVQWKYGYARRLPNDAPAEFVISASDVGPVAKDEAVRRRYWQQLRTTWNLSSAWKNEWGWSFSTFRQSLRTGGDWWRELVRSIIGH